MLKYIDLSNLSYTISLSLQVKSIVKNQIFCYVI